MHEGQGSTVAVRFDPYKTLQVDPEAEPDVIQAAYRRLASRYHPDRGGGPEAAERMVALNRAWEILSVPSRRAALDAELAAERSRDAATVNAAAADVHGTAGGDRPGSSAASATTRGPAADDSSFASFTSGRSAVGGGYDPATMRSPDGTGAAGPPPGNPFGPALNFGRYSGWSLGEISRRDPEYLEWLDRMPIGRPYRDDIDSILRRLGLRRSPQGDSGERRGLFRRR